MPDSRTWQLVSQNAQLPTSLLTKIFSSSTLKILFKTPSLCKPFLILLTLSLSTSICGQKILSHGRLGADVTCSNLRARKGFKI